MLSVIADGYDWFDVGLTGINSPGYCNNRHCSNTTIQDLNDMLVKPGIPLEHWANYKFTISIDGHGSPYRLAHQYMLGTVIHQIESTYMPWFTPVFKANVHYIPVKVLEGIVETSRQAVLEGREKPDKYEQMVNNAQQQGIDSFNIHGQLDSFMWAVLNAKHAQNWEVKEPAAGNWVRVDLNRHSWTAPIPEQVRDLVSQSA